LHLPSNLAELLEVRHVGRLVDQHDLRSGDALPELLRVERCDEAVLAASHDP